MVLFLIIGAGVVAALQIGKAIIAMPVIQAEMGLSLVEVSTLLSTFAIFGATIGMPSGVLVPRFGGKNALLAGLAMIAAGNLLGLLSQSFGPLLASRVVEGVGFIVVATAAPLLLARASGEENRRQVFALWGIYMPMGMGLMVLSGALFETADWRVLWGMNAALACLWLIAAACAIPGDPDANSGKGEPLESLRSLLRTFWADRAPFAVMAAFFFYGNLYFAVIGLLPPFLNERFALPLSGVALLTALVIFANLAGNLVAGSLLARGFAFHRVMLGALTAATVLCAALFLVPGNAGTAAFVGALAFAAAGMFPASVMASAALLTRDLRYVGAMIGLFMQGSTLGQFTGPPTFSFMVERLGWGTAWLFVGMVGSAGVGFTLLVGRTLRTGAANASASMR